MLQPLDHTRIPALQNIDPFFLNPGFDPGRQYSVPYLWGSVGIGYRKSAVTRMPTSWKDLFVSDKYAGRIALLDDPLIVMRLAMKAMGKSLNDLSDANIAAAGAMIRRQSDNIVAFAPDNGQDLLLSGEADLVMEWNNTWKGHQDWDPELRYHQQMALGCDGTTLPVLWIDTLDFQKFQRI